MKVISHSFRRKTTRLKYDPPYVKKPAAKYIATANTNHHSIEEMSLDGTNKLMYNNQNQFGYCFRMQIFFSKRQTDDL
jgi:hypothetical protein